MNRGRWSVLPLMLAASAVHGSQACPAGNTISTPDGSLTDNGNATVTHIATGLMWKQCTEGLTAVAGSSCSGALQEMTWAGAQAAALVNNIDNFGGHADWRVPNVKELQSIIETGCFNPSINLTRFPFAGAVGYWTSTTLFAVPADAWGVSFTSGISFTDVKTAAYYVRLVRGGASFGAFDAASGHCTLDVDGNGTQDALTDGMLILRAMFGMTGTSVTNGAIGGNSPARTKWADIRSYLNGSCGGNFNP